MEKDLEEFRKERDLIVGEIGEFDEEDFRKSGISLEEYNNPTEETIQKLILYVREEYDQTAIYSE
jgi:hypothetical protein